jgi:hypothetical protein
MPLHLGAQRRQGGKIGDGHRLVSALTSGGAPPWWAEFAALMVNSGLRSAKEVNGG